ncbi:DnaA_homol_Hda, DnaA regulatory inactivator Hda [Sphingomonadaceae bacterium]|jgi:chromosomal replication initiation ATPase DnaA|nr:MAG: DnaA/Hda family protein [Sphingobium sp.]
MQQIALPFDELDPGRTDDCLIITAANAIAFAALGNHSAWPGHCAILVGPKRSGKSLMGRYFAAQGGQAIDDAETLGEVDLFHRWNAAKNAGQGLLLLSGKLPGDWLVELPDLRSRLGAAQLLEIGEPDDELAEQLLLKYLRDRGTSIGPEALAFVLRRIERSYAAVEDFAKRANALALAEGSAITLPLVRRLV